MSLSPWAKFALLFAATLALGACVGTPGDTSSSAAMQSSSSITVNSSRSQSHSSSSLNRSSSSRVASSSSDSLGANLLNGQQQYDTQCAGCHDKDGIRGVSTATGATSHIVSSFTFEFLCDHAICTDQVALAAYIESEMPLARAEQCVGDCARDIAAFIATFPKQAGNNSSQSSAASSSTPSVIYEYPGDALKGAEIYENRCETCHGVGGLNGAVNSPLTPDLCVTCGDPQTLIRKIVATMPSPGACVGDCAIDVATYIKTLQGSAPTSCGNTGIQPGKSPLRRLNKREYVNSIVDLFGVSASLANDFPDENVQKGFDTNADGLDVSEVQVDAYAAIAKKVAAAAVKDLSASSTSPEVIFAVNVGGTEQKGGGVTYQADENSLHRNSEGSTQNTPTFDVANTNLDDVYRYVRWGAELRYKIPIANGKYKVFLMFSENNFSAAGQRTFDVTIEGEKRLSAYDIFAEAGGRRTAKQQAVNNVEVTDGFLNINFTAIKDKASIAGIRVQTIPQANSAIINCGTLNDECAQGFITDFGQKVYRRPLTVAESDALKAIFSAGQTALDFKAGMQLVIEAMLQSPAFIYRAEFGSTSAANNGVVPLTSWEMATRLSYLFWASTPDETLMNLAEQDKLTTPAQIRTQAERLLNDARAKSVVRDYYTQWLGIGDIADLERTAASYPGFTANTPNQFRRETEAFIDHVFWDGTSTLDELLTAEFTFANNDLAKFYGITEPGSENYVKVTNPGRNYGILTQASLMATRARDNETAPILRGVFVMENLMCVHVSPPPPCSDEDEMAGKCQKVDIVFPPLDNTVTTRERWDQTTGSGVCYNCHRILNPVGFTFENFDPVGRWRNKENGFAIDASGEILGTDVDGTVNGVADLAQILANSDQVAHCAVVTWANYAYGRHLDEAGDDRCSIEQAYKGFTASGENLKTLLIELTQTEAFMYRNEVK